MKCPKCSAWGNVLETRSRENGYKYRRYKCANGHPFKTYEVIVCDEDNYSKEPVNIKITRTKLKRRK